MIKTFKSLIVLLLVVACQNGKIKKPEVPDNLLSEKKMVKVIYDMVIINGAKGVNKKLLEKEGINPELFVYELNQIDSLQFAESSNYYAYDLKVYERIISKVKQRLQNDKERFDAELKEEKRLRDSIAALEEKVKDSIKAKAVMKKKTTLDGSKKVDTSQLLIRQ
ncbi:MAG: DUF4296 domain-containing protein [Flavobacteriaceae bacterium]|nr:DUF4296 domain-containing protein [Flavobacteriaceae bacterium]